MNTHTQRMHEVAPSVFTVDVFIQYHNTMLMFKRSESKKAFPGWWAVPGGHIDEGENPLAAAIRETEEETGIRLSASGVQLKFIATHHHIDRKEQWIVFGFLAKVTQKPVQLLQTHEGTAQWIEKSALIAMENVLPPVKYYFEHVLNDKSGIMYTYSTWKDTQLLNVQSELVDTNA